MNQQELLAERYGRGSRSKKRDYILGATVAVVASVAYLIWSGFVTQTNAVKPTGKAVSYEVLSDKQLRLDFVVENAQGKVVSCELQALASDYEIVGWRQVDYPLGMPSVTTLIATYKPAVTGVVKSCWVK